MSETLPRYTIEQVVSVEYRRLARLRLEKGDQAYVKALGERVADILVLLTEGNGEDPLRLFGEVNLENLIAVAKSFEDKGVFLSAIHGLCSAINNEGIGPDHTELDTLLTRPEISRAVADLVEAIIDHMNFNIGSDLTLYEALENFLSVDDWEVRTFVLGIFKGLREHNIIESSSIS